MSVSGPLWDGTKERNEGMGCMFVCIGIAIIILAVTLAHHYWK
jgi:hypothetical protein